MTKTYNYTWNTFQCVSLSWLRYQHCFSSSSDTLDKCCGSKLEMSQPWTCSAIASNRFPCPELCELWSCTCNMYQHHLARSISKKTHGHVQIKASQRIQEWATATMSHHDPSTFPVWNWMWGHLIINLSQKPNSPSSEKHQHVTNCQVSNAHGGKGPNQIWAVPLGRAKHWAKRSLGPILKPTDASKHATKGIGWNLFL